MSDKVRDEVLVEAARTGIVFRHEGRQMAAELIELRKKFNQVLEPPEKTSLGHYWIFDHRERFYQAYSSIGEIPWSRTKRGFDYWSDVSESLSFEYGRRA